MSDKEITANESDPAIVEAPQASDFSSAAFEPIVIQGGE